MTVLPDDLPLAADFPDATREQWQRLVEGVLRKTGASEATGEEAEEALATDLGDGVRTRPLYTAQDAPQEPLGHPGFAPYTRGARAEGAVAYGWDVRGHHQNPDPRRANEAILADLENGVTSLWLTLGGSALPVDALPQALDGVYLDLAPVVLDAGPEFATAGPALLELYAQREVPAASAQGNLGADPLGLAARTGDHRALDEHWEAAAGLARRCTADHPKVRALTVDALPYHEAGATAVEELGCSTAAGVAALRALTARDLSPQQAAGQLEFRYAATADQFLTLAKLRAARRLWARVAEVCQVTGDSAAQRQHAVTSPVMMTRRDPWVNMLRTTVATLGAGVGGAQAVTVLPFDSALGLPDAFARRIARNTSTILIEESHLARVIDPAGGSWYVERLTDELARAGWERFRELERDGGLARALASGELERRLADSWQRRRKALATRREPITGVSEFPLLDEREPDRDPAPAPPTGGLPRVRRDEEYEALRARSDAHRAATGQRPRVFLAALGSPAQHTARVAFASNLFQTGGVEAVHQPTTVDASEVAEAFAASGAALACLCSSDEVYQEQATEVAGELKRAGAARVYLAGRPGEHRQEWREAGVDEFVHLGRDVVEILGTALDTLQVA
ncbi:methylmalonyl-CoA mutase subunit beta [Streptomyces sp. NPDC005438]|uniref:methylmalonyl-CoA mutase subunit beta n=1 Tax=Streptomyces sp. NPDC005438 TaxID=3156880 RepID=UPI0033A5643E